MHIIIIQRYLENSDKSPRVFLKIRQFNNRLREENNHKNYNVKNVIIFSYKGNKSI